jgi:hypothetical protein
MHNMDIESDEITTSSQAWRFLSCFLLFWAIAVVTGSWLVYFLIQTFY